MRFLKGLAISLLSFLLFLSLSIFSLVFMLNQTILNPDFVTSQISKLDLPAIVRETGIINQISQQMGQQISQQVGQQIPQAEEIIAKVLNDTLLENEPWIKEQAKKAIYTFYGYVLGEGQSFNLTIPISPIKDSLAANLRKAVLESPPPQLALVPPEMREQIVGGLVQGLTQQMPASFDFNESMFTTEVRGILAQVRQYAGYAKTAYPLLIGLMVFLALCIALIYREVKRATRSLGSTLLTYGVLGYAGIFASQYFLETRIGTLGLPSVIQDWLPQFLNSLWAPVQTFNIAVAIAGLVLVIASIVYPKKPETAD